jgi:hypothetical protein
MSPYLATMREVAERFCTTQARADLFAHWVRHRKALSAIALTGFQWIDGSFCEDVERLRGRPPADIDMMTAIIRPQHLFAPAVWTPFVAANAALLDRDQVKANYHCDVLFIDGTLPAFVVHPQLTYCFGLFTHQRTTYLWKGLVQVPFPADDDAALNFIGTLSLPP